MISTQHVSQPVTIDGEQPYSQDEFTHPSLYSQLTLRTKLILPYLVLAVTLAVATGYFAYTVGAAAFGGAIGVGVITAVLILIIGHQHATMLADPIEDLMIASLRVGAGDYSIDMPLERPTSWGNWPRASI